jgi:hypothetical protein
MENFFLMLSRLWLVIHSLSTSIYFPFTHIVKATFFPPRSDKPRVPMLLLLLLLLKQQNFVFIKNKCRIFSILFFLGMASETVYNASGTTLIHYIALNMTCIVLTIISLCVDSLLKMRNTYWVMIMQRWMLICIAWLIDVWVRIETFPSSFYSTKKIPCSKTYWNNFFIIKIHMANG